MVIIVTCVGYTEHGICPACECITFGLCHYKTVIHAAKTVYAAWFKAFWAVARRETNRSEKVGEVECETLENCSGLCNTVHLSASLVHAASSLSLWPSGNNTFLISPKIPNNPKKSWLPLLHSNHKDVLLSLSPSLSHEWSSSSVLTTHWTAIQNTQQQRRKTRSQPMRDTAKRKQFSRA